MPAPYGLSREELERILAGEPAYRARQVWDGLHVRVQRPEEMTELPPRLRADLEAALPPALVELSRRTADAGETTKWLWALGDGSRVETVLMHYPDRVTVCVSTQAGCAMACQFCATGQAGFQRHLTEGEIVEQVAVAVREARPRRLSNVVFMGMGEPLANYDRVWAAVTKLHGEMGLSAPPAHPLDGGHRSGHPAAGGRVAPGQPGPLAARRQRLAAQRAGSDQPALPDRQVGRGMRGVRSRQRTPTVHRVGLD